MNKAQRHQAGYFNAAEACRFIGITNERYQYHTSHGYAPRPSHKIGAKCFYRAEEIERLKEYFSSRKRWQHQRDTFPSSPKENENARTASMPGERFAPNKLEEKLTTNEEANVECNTNPKEANATT